jgi:spore germination cell wall hydrolase CwlJ-like protein
MRGLVAALLVSLIGAGFSAHAGLTSIAAEDHAQPTEPEPTGYAAEDHFPGAALFTAVDDSASGATGTAEPPDLPVPAGAIVDESVHAAAPFVFRGSASDRARALECLTDAVYYEAAREPVEGQRAVAQVVLNRVRHPAFPGTVCGVVFEGSEHAGCQFSFACDGAMGRAPEQSYWQRARAVAAEALRGAVFAPAGLATHYHSYMVRPDWNRALVMTGAFGAHFFHRWKGWWGTPAAFSRAYGGHEPLPGPHPPVLPEMVPALVATPATTTRTPPVMAAESAPARSSDVAENLPDSQVLDRWKDSGKPLR